MNKSNAKSLRPLRVSASAAQVVFNRHPVESPTLGAATALAGASLDSPTADGAPRGFSGAASGAVPSSLMPPPLAGALTRSSSGLAGKSYVAPPSVSVSTEGEAGPRSSSTSPSKRSRSGEEDESTSVPGLTVEQPSDKDDSDDEEPLSPSKRQVRKSVAERPVEQPPPAVTIVDMFSPGMLRVNVFRIPSLLTLPSGVTLTFAEARPRLHDHGVINLAMRRSTDGGVSWSPARVIVEGAMIGAARSATVGNPTAVYDSHTGTIWLLLCSNHADDCEWMIHAREGRDTRRVWLTSSPDLGETWAKPHEITSSVKLPSWTWYATGPGRAIQLQSGRLLVPANHAEDVHEAHRPYLPHPRNRSRMVAHCVYSDDHGKSWHIGGIAAKHTNETTLAQLADGEIILNSRDWSGRFERVIQRSRDDGKTWGAPKYDPTLIEPEPQGCQGSSLALPPKGGGSKKGVLFFCNPSSDRREMLTIRRSDDGGASWSSAYCLEEGASAYSSLGLCSDGALGVLYERGDRISFAKIPPHPSGPLGDF